MSILSGVSNILEKAIHSHYVKFLEQNNILFDFQSGFIHILDYIKGNTAKGMFTGMLLLDLQKAFDTVDHKIL